MGETVNIEVDDEVFALLQAKAQPLVDTPSDVLRRLLGDDKPQKPAAKKASKKAAKAAKKQAGRRLAARQYAPRGSLVPEDDYVKPILQALIAAGGSGRARDITDAVGRRLEHRFSAAEHVVTVANEPRWRNRTRDVRMKLVKQGLIARPAPDKFGIWEITAEGRRQASGL